MENRLRQFRERQNISAAALALAAGVTRQTVHAIEAGSFVPNTAAALKMARKLRTTVEELFGEPYPTEHLAQIEMAVPVPDGQPVRLARVGNHIIGIPAIPFAWPEADGIAHPAGMALPDQDRLENRIAIAGCDPAIAILARHLAQRTPFELVALNCSSTKSLDLLSQGKIHIAGTHLGKAPGRNLRAFTFASWEEGLVVAQGNPKKIETVADLARRGVSIVNRETGAGSRLLLDRNLRRLGLKPASVSGYTRFASGHLQAAWFVSAGIVDACIAPFAAARAYGLSFVPLAVERFDLIIPRKEFAAKAVQALLASLQTASVRNQLSGIAGYDTSRTGMEVDF